MSPSGVPPGNLSSSTSGEGGQQQVARNKGVQVEAEGAKSSSESDDEKPDIALVAALPVVAVLVMVAAGVGLYWWRSHRSKWDVVSTHTATHSEVDV